MRPRTIFNMMVAAELKSEYFWCPVMSNIKPTEPVAALIIYPVDNAISNGHAPIKLFPDNASKGTEKSVVIKNIGRLSVIVHFVTILNIDASRLCSFLV